MSWFGLELPGRLPVVRGHEGIELGDFVDFRVFSLLGRLFMGDFLVSNRLVFVHPLLQDRSEQPLSREVAGRATGDVAQDVFEERLLLFVSVFGERAFVTWSDNCTD